MPKNASTKKNNNKKGQTEQVQSNLDSSLVTPQDNTQPLDENFVQDNTQTNVASGSTTDSSSTGKRKHSDTKEVNTNTEQKKRNVTNKPARSTNKDVPPHRLDPMLLFFLHAIYGADTYKTDKDGNTTKELTDKAKRHLDATVKLNEDSLDDDIEANKTKIENQKKKLNQNSKNDVPETREVALSKAKESVEKNQKILAASEAKVTDLENMTDEEYEQKYIKNKDVESIQKNIQQCEAKIEFNEEVKKFLRNQAMIRGKALMAFATFADGE